MARGRPGRRRERVNDLLVRSLLGKTLFSSSKIRRRQRREEGTTRAMEGSEKMSFGERKPGGGPGSGVQERGGGKRKFEDEATADYEGRGTEKDLAKASPIKKGRFENVPSKPSNAHSTPTIENPSKSAVDQTSGDNTSAQQTSSKSTLGKKSTPGYQESLKRQPRGDEHTTQKQSHSGSRKVDIIHGISRDTHLLHHFISFLNLPSLISLYAISKPFHFYLNTSYTAVILSSVRTWAPGAEKIYPWRCYKTLCIKDPAQRRKLRLQDLPATEMKQKWLELRDVPSLNWLQMVVYREGVCQDMLIVMRGQGLLCPPGTLEAVKKMWFLMDLPLNAQRIALIQDRKYITNDNLQHFTMFLLKVDMLLTDPMAPSHPMAHPNTRVFPPKDAGHSPSGIGLRKLLLAERQMTPLWRAIRGWTPDPMDIARPMTRLDMLRLWIRHKYKPSETLPEATRKQDIMGVPWWEVGTAGQERTGVSFADASKANGTKVGGERAQSSGQPSASRTAASHPSIVPSGAESLYWSQIEEHTQHHSQAHIAYSGEHTIHPSILSRGIRRDPLLRPDELVMREAVRRRLSYHKEWIKWLAWGFCGMDGSEWDVLDEREWLEVLRGRKYAWNTSKSEYAGMASQLWENGKLDGGEAAETDGQGPIAANGAVGDGETNAQEQGETGP